MEKRNTLEDMQFGAGKKIARAFFLEFITPTDVTKREYPNAYKMRTIKKRGSFVISQVSKRFNHWKKEGFLDESKYKLPRSIEKKKGKNYTLWFYGYRLNLKPLFKYCNDQGVNFTEDEKYFINELLGSSQIRKNILKENQGEDVINAILKYYVKNTIMRYFSYMRDFKENPEKYLNYQKRVDKYNHPKDAGEKETKKIIKEYARVHSSKKYRYGIDIDIMELITNELPISPLNEVFKKYIREINGRVDFIKTLDDKILISLRIK